MTAEPSPSLISTYRAKAEEIRAAAEGMHEPARSVLLRLAASYLRIADGYDALEANVESIDAHPITPSKYTE